MPGGTTGGSVSMFLLFSIALAQEAPAELTYALPAEGTVESTLERASTTRRYGEGAGSPTVLYRGRVIEEVSHPVPDQALTRITGFELTEGELVADPARKASVEHMSQVMPPLVVDATGAFVAGPHWDTWWSQWPRQLARPLAAMNKPTHRQVLDQVAAPLVPLLREAAPAETGMPGTRAGLPAVPGACRDLPADGPHMAYAPFVAAGFDVGLPATPPMTWTPGKQCVEAVAPCSSADGAPMCAVVVETLTASADIRGSDAQDLAQPLVASGQVSREDLRYYTKGRVALEGRWRVRVQVDTLTEWERVRSRTATVHLKVGGEDVLLYEHVETSTVTRQP